LCIQVFITFSILE